MIATRMRGLEEEPGEEWLSNAKDLWTQVFLTVFLVRLL